MKKHKFKAKSAIYYISAWLIIGIFAIWGAKGLKNNWIISAAEADLTKVKAAMASVQELSEENAKLKEIVNSIGADDKPVVVNLLNDGSAKSKAMFRARKKWGDNELWAFEQLLTHESGFNPNIANKKSGACGLFQALPCEKMPSLDINDQIDWGLNYIQNRYKLPSEAWRFWLSQSPHWY